LFFYKINIRENRRDNQKWTIQRNWQHTDVGYTRKQKRQSKMDNPEKLATYKCRVHKKTEGQSKMDNPEKLATYKCRVHKKTEGTIKNGQSRETGNIQM
jgi:hypothetical protein